MNLDFTELDNLENEALGGDIRGFVNKSDIHRPLEFKTLLNPLLEPNKGKEPYMDINPANKQEKRYLTIEKDKEILEKAKEAYADYQKNIKATEILRSEINQDIHAGFNLFKTLLKALECISLMTGDNNFYEGNKAKLTQIQGVLGINEAVELEMEEVTRRLFLLEAVENPAANVKNAIAEHKKKQNELTALFLENHQ